MGRLILADLYLCRREILDDEKKLREIIMDMLRNFGESCSEIPIILSGNEGHMGLFKLDGARISFQTFPGYDYFAFEVCVLGKKDPSLYSEYLVEKVAPQVVNIREFARAEHLETSTFMKIDD